MRRTIFLVLLLLLPLGLAWGQDYSGPKCLGPLCLGQKASDQQSIRLLGPYDSSPCCFYRTNNKNVLLIVHSRDESDELGTLDLSLRSSPRVPYEEGYAPTAQNLRAWKTPEGIGLGSSEEEVFKAYGKPSREEAFGSEPLGAQSPEKGLVYKGKSGPSRSAAAFGVRGGKIISIALYRSSYAGPDCLGPFCLSNTLKKPGSVFKELGHSTFPIQASPSLYPYCYQSPDGKEFVRVVMSHETPPEPSAMFLSDFPTCMHVSKKFSSTSTADLGQWRTPEGIGLGSNVEDVLRAYGKPTRDRKSKLIDPRVIFPGSKVGETVPDAGDRTLDYTSGALLLSEFGIRNGRVSYIELSNSE